MDTVDRHWDIRRFLYFYEVENEEEVLRYIRNVESHPLVKAFRSHNSEVVISLLNTEPIFSGDFIVAIEVFPEIAVDVAIKFYTTFPFVGKLQIRQPTYGYSILFSLNELLWSESNIEELHKLLSANLLLFTQFSTIITYDAIKEFINFSDISSVEYRLQQAFLDAPLDVFWKFLEDCKKVLTLKEIQLNLIPFSLFNFDKLADNVVIREIFQLTFLPEEVFETILDGYEHINIDAFEYFISLLQEGGYSHELRNFKQKLLEFHEEYALHLSQLISQTKLIQ